MAKQRIFLMFDEDLQVQTLITLNFGSFTTSNGEFSGRIGKMCIVITIQVSNWWYIGLLKKFYYPSSLLSQLCSCVWGGVSCTMILIKVVNLVANLDNVLPVIYIRRPAGDGSTYLEFGLSGNNLSPRTNWNHWFLHFYIYFCWLILLNNELLINLIIRLIYKKRSFSFDATSNMHFRRHLSQAIKPQHISEEKKSWEFYIFTSVWSIHWLWLNYAIYKQKTSANFCKSIITLQVICVHWLFYAWIWPI